MSTVFPKIGGSYKLRRGEIVKVTDIDKADAAGDRRVVFDYKNTSGSNSWYYRPDGRWAGSDRNWDFVEELTTPTLREGGTYRLRDGQIASIKKITPTYGSDVNVRFDRKVGASECWNYNSKGEWLTGLKKMGTCEFDIVEEITSTWSLVVTANDGSSKNLLTKNREEVLTFVQNYTTEDPKLTKLKADHAALLAKAEELGSTIKSMEVR